MRVFHACVAVVALHTATDAFFAPARGTGWPDHIVPAVASLSVLAAAAWTYPRSRDGVRAALALTLGALTLVGFALAVASARVGGPAGDDWTGLLLGPAGVALLGLGLLTLWRSRKPVRHAFLRRGLIALGAALAVFWVVTPVAVAIFATRIAFVWGAQAACLLVSAACRKETLNSRRQAAADNRLAAYAPQKGPDRAFSTNIFYPFLSA